VDVAPRNGTCKIFMLNFYLYKQIATNRFASCQGNFYHGSMFLTLLSSDTKRTYVV
jgi:hypothetical protein